MGELEKILFIINRWGYLNLEQFALLLNKNIKTIQLQKEQLIKLKMLNVDTLPKKNYFTLTSKAQSHLGREHKKSIQVIGALPLIASQYNPTHFSKVRQMAWTPCQPNQRFLVGSALIYVLLTNTLNNT
ncbi:hypothetical protein [Spiroplasma endosymbiont of Nebria brevicollis]|uniref:hypothetical protein n=1 Tax=Spiroplasma endosymbiont of Nebria brevicollis TaxID=3066284 RepID=UPI00313DD886